MALHSGGALLGAAAFQRKLKAWTKDIREAAAKGGFEWAERTMAVSKDGGEGYGGNIVPRDTLNLMNSGHVQWNGVPIKGATFVIRQSGKIVFTLAYGGPAGAGGTNTKDVGYATFVHEINKNYNQGLGGPNPRGTDYLRGPVNYMEKKITEIIGPHIKDALK